MGPLRFQFCSNSFLSPVMWILGLCVFKPIIPKTEVVLAKEGIILSQSIEIQLDLNYKFVLCAEVLKDETNKKFDLQSHIMIKFLGPNNKSVFTEHRFEKAGLTSYNSEERCLESDSFFLTKGKYDVEVNNLTANVTSTGRRYFLLLTKAGPSK